MYVATNLCGTVHTSYNLNVTRVYHACVDHEMDTRFCCTRVENKEYSYLIAYTISLNAIDTKTMTSTTDEYNKSQPINRLMFRIL